MNKKTQNWIQIQEFLKYRMVLINIPHPCFEYSNYFAAWTIEKPLSDKLPTVCYCDKLMIWLSFFLIIKVKITFAE